MRSAHSRLLRSSRIAAPNIVHMAAYANTLTRLIPDFYNGMTVVSREMVGFLPSVMRNTGAERAAMGQSILYLKSVAQTTFNIQPAMSIPEPADKGTAYGEMKITKCKGVEFGWTGEEQRGLNNGGPGFISVQAQWFAEGLRTLVNEMESDLALEAARNACRATGTPGVTPFSGDQIADSAQLRKILDDNGAPQNGRSMIIDTAAGAQLRTVKNLTRVNEAGTQMTLRDGELLNLHGFSIKETGAGAVMYQTAGNAASATTNAAGYAKGATIINLAAAGTGAILANDVVSFAGDSNKYLVVNVRDDGVTSGGDANVSAGGSIQIAAPGLRVAIPAAATAITVAASHQMNVGFSADALQFIARAPALPQEGDAAIDRTMIMDPRSGMSFEIALYAGYRKIRAEIGAAWGQKATDPTHIAGLMG